MTQSELKELINYNEHTGIFIWLKGKCKGLSAGSVTKQGYYNLHINKKVYQAHRLVWLYVYGKLPTTYIDHIDGNRINNKLNNLRECNHTENLHNRKLNKNSTTKVKGLFIHTSGLFYQACIVKDKKKKTSKNFSINRTRKRRSYFMVKSN